MMKPEPRLCARRSGLAWSSLPPPPPPLPPWPGRLRLRKSLKNCSNGDPGGNIGISGPVPPGGPFLVVMVWLDDTLTTAGSNLAASSAKLSGADRASAGLVEDNGPGSGSDVTSANDAPSRGGRAAV